MIDAENQVACLQELCSVMLSMLIDLECGYPWSELHMHMNDLREIAGNLGVAELSGS